jgi:hypothetical protein
LLDIKVPPLTFLNFFYYVSIILPCISFKIGGGIVALPIYYPVAVLPLGLPVHKIKELAVCFANYTRIILFACLCLLHKKYLCHNNLKIKALTFKKEGRS